MAEYWVRNFTWELHPSSNKGLDHPAEWLFFIVVAPDTKSHTHQAYTQHTSFVIAVRQFHLVWANWASGVWQSENVIYTSWGEQRSDGGRDQLNHFAPEVPLQKSLKRVLGAPKTPLKAQLDCKWQHLISNSNADWMQKCVYQVIVSVCDRPD